MEFEPGTFLLLEEGSSAQGFSASTGPVFLHLNLESFLFIPLFYQEQPLSLLSSFNTPHSHVRKATTVLQSPRFGFLHLFQTRT